MMTLDDQLLSEAKTVRERLLDLQHEVDVARVDYQHVIRRLHAAGGSMREIAESLGLSHQRVHQIVDAGPEDARTRGFRDGGHRPFRAPFTRQARVALAAADEEAATLGHGYLGTEHLLLGLFRAERGGAAAALATLGLTYDGVQKQVVDRFEGEPRQGTSRVPFTPQAKKVLEHAVGEGGGGGRHRRIGTEQLLVSLATVTGGLANELLAAAGADEAKVREALASVRGR